MITSREKKGYIILAIILIVIGYFVYSHFFGNSEQAQTTVQNFSSAKFLPNGAKLDLAPTQQPLFQQLVPPNYPVVNRSEVGNPNPFK